MDREQQTHRRLRWLIPAACLALLLCAALLVLPRLLSREKAEAPSAAAGGELAEIPHWEDLVRWEQYRRIEFDGVEYDGRGPIDAAAAGETLGTATARGWDEYTETEYTLDCTVYALTGFSPAAALAVRYAGDDTCYVCAAADYHSETLGALIDDLALEQQASFGSVYYETREDGYLRNTEYTGLDPAVLWTLLLNDRTLVNEGPEHYGIALMDLSVSVEALGIRNVSLAVNAEGYLQTNLISTGASYYLGPERVQAFVDYVLTHCEGTVVYETELTASAGDDGDSQSTPAYDPGA